MSHKLWLVHWDITHRLTYQWRTVIGGPYTRLNIFIYEDRLLSSPRSWFHIFTISNKIVHFQPWYRPLSPWIVWFSLKIVRFDERSSAFARIVCFGPWIVCFRPGSSALILFRIVCFYTQGSSAFDPTRTGLSTHGNSILSIDLRKLLTKT